jgi:ketosteroid isomerase-like protein
MANDDLAARAAAFQCCIEERDAIAAEDLLDDDYALVLVHPAPAVMPRARWIEVLADYVVHDHEVLESITDVDPGGDCAAILQRVRQRATVLGGDRSGEFVLTDIWRRRDGQWRIWRRHSTPMAAGEMPGA